MFYRTKIFREKCFFFSFLAGKRSKYFFVEYIPENGVINRVGNAHYIREAAKDVPFFIGSAIKRGVNVVPLRKN